MRVIAGKFKGRGLLCPPGLSVRPTADATKETIFNLLAGRLDAADALDLFAGVGALGIEAVSRGAASIHFVERDRSALKYLVKNLERAGVKEEARITRGDVFAWIKKPRPGERLYDMAFVDPPYGRGNVARLLELEERNRLLVPGGALVIQHHSKERVDFSDSRYLFGTERALGDTVVTLLFAR